MRSMPMKQRPHHQARWPTAPLAFTPSKITDTSTLQPEADTAITLIKQLSLNVMKAQDNLLAAKVAQAEFTNQHHGDEHCFAIGDRVMLSTKHQCREYMQTYSGRSAKFMPRFDGPYCIVRSHPVKSNYTLELPNKPNHFPTFHSSLLHPYQDNNNNLLPFWALAMPSPVVTTDGEEEWMIEWILDEHKCSRGYQYLIQWHG
jgi:hypothetical protein